MYISCVCLYVNMRVYVSLWLFQASLVLSNFPPLLSALPSFPKPIFPRPPHSALVLLSPSAALFLLCPAVPFYFHGLRAGLSRLRADIRKVTSKGYHVVIVFLSVGCLIQCHIFLFHLFPCKFRSFTSFLDICQRVMSLGPGSSAFSFWDIYTLISIVAKAVCNSATSEQGFSLSTPSLTFGFGYLNFLILAILSRVRWNMKIVLFAFSNY